MWHLIFDNILWYEKFSLFCSNSANVFFILNVLTDQRNSIFLFIDEKYYIYNKIKKLIKSVQHHFRDN